MMVASRVVDLDEMLVVATAGKMAAYLATNWVAYSDRPKVGTKAMWMVGELVTLKVGRLDSTLAALLGLLREHKKDYYLGFGLAVEWENSSVSKKTELLAQWWAYWLAVLMAAAMAL
jgi:hypothetical protein